ncbi:hypothetical protein IWQ56_005185 [Coemansia nantahalensis]|nr:hypothetical protein IWQ56_005185 [Coemansia nantahalensis]
MDDSVELVSGGWCKVRRPSGRGAPELALKQERVSMWVAALPAAVRYEPLPGSELPQWGSSPLKSVVRCRSLSDASLADFLQCQAPCRPSFLDPPHRAADATAVAAAAAAATVTQGSAGLPPRRRASTRAGPGDACDGYRVGGAEFLSRAFSHFAEFQPLDFSHASPESSATVTPESPGFSAGSEPPTPAKWAMPGDVWSFVAGLLNDFARDAAFA